MQIIRSHLNRDPNLGEIDIFLQIICRYLEVDKNREDTKPKLHNFLLRGFQKCRLEHRACAVPLSFGHNFAHRRMREVQRDALLIKTCAIQIKITIAIPPF